MSCQDILGILSGLVVGVVILAICFLVGVGVATLIADRRDR